MTDRFSLGDELPSGLLVLEASAGTGKTWSLEGLAVRAIAERELTASQLCVVSFTRLATADLRSRIRRRLVDSAIFLESSETTSTDELHRVLIDGVDASTRALRAQRLRQAVAEFDSASITTIHGFCTRVLASGGADASLPVQDDDDDVVELVDDAIVALIAEHRDEPGWSAPSRDGVLEAVRLRLKLPDARFFTIARGDGDEWLDIDGSVVKFKKGQEDKAIAIEAFVELVERLVAEVIERRATRRLRTNDSILTDARALLRSPKGPGVIAALREAFGLVLIDEFQDTDRVQWDIFQAAFLDEVPGLAIAAPTVVVVGDPKQSIYRFRSAELNAYLEARATAERSTSGAVRSLDTNFRSDPDLLDALEQLFSGFTFGAAEIDFQSVAARPDAPRRGIEHTDTVALQIRDVGGASDRLAWAIDDCVAEVVRLLDHASIDEGGSRRAVKPSDIGIIVRGNPDADAIAAALEVAGVPASSSSSASVLGSEAARQISTFLLALERPSSVGRLRAAALGWFVGDDHRALADRDDEAMGELADRFRTWGAALTGGGLPALMVEVRRAGLPAHLLARPQGDRNLTDLDHIVELLQTVTRGARLTPTAMLAAFESLDRTTGAGDEAVAAELLARRVDRDDQTVTVVTIHKSKGLEFPIVLCPTMYKDRSYPSRLKHAELEVRGERRRTIDTAKLVESKAALFNAVDPVEKEEYTGEDRRLLYVALTRAKHRLVVWWNPGVKSSALRELMDHALDGRTLDELVAESAGTIGVVTLSDRPAKVTWERPADDHGELAAARARRRFDRSWRSWSFTQMTGEDERVRGRAQAVVEVVDVVEHSAGHDEPPVDDVEIESSTTALGPLQDAPRGKTFGVLMHALFERLDFADPDLETTLRDDCARALQYRRLRTTPDVLAAGLLESLSAPLGGPLGSTRLRDLARADRLDELSFDLPLAGFRASQIAEVLVRHLPDDDLMRPWAERVVAGEFDFEVDGMLTGSIDLVARSEIDGEARFWLADYKSNHRGDGDYSVEGLVDTMSHSGYALQATVYSVALHRYLRWRVTDYDPEQHLLGTAYLFVRGMRPENDPADPAGVLWWRVPTAALLELDELFARGDA